MGIFSKLFNHGETSNVEAGVSGQDTSIPSVNGVELLDLSKGDILDLSKVSDSLTTVRAAAGWDVNKGSGHDYDLDLCAYLCTSRCVKGTVYYSSKSANGIHLDGDNLTGAGDGDDENIFVTLSKIDRDVERIIFAVVIYDARSRGQKFGRVKNAYMRLIDETTGKEICRYRLSDDGGDNTAAILASLNKDGSGNWSFEAIGKYTKGSIGSIKDEVLR